MKEIIYRIVRDDNGEEIVPYTFIIKSDAIKLCAILNNENFNKDCKYTVKTITKK